MIVPNNNIINQKRYACFIFLLKINSVVIHIALGDASSAVIVVLSIVEKAANAIK